MKSGDNKKKSLRAGRNIYMNLTDYIHTGTTVGVTKKKFSVKKTFDIGNPRYAHTPSRMIIMLFPRDI